MSSMAFALSEPKLRVNALALLFCVLWSSAFVVGKIGLRDCPPLLLLAQRFLLAGLLLLPVLYYYGQRLPRTWREWWPLIGIGVCNTALNLGLVFWGMQTVPAGLTTLLAATNPLATLILAHHLLGEQYSWRKFSALGLGVLGVACVLQGQWQFGSAGLIGCMAILASTWALALGSIGYKRLAPSTGLLTLNVVQNLSGGLVLLPVSLLTEDWGLWQPSLSLALVLLYLAGVVSIAAVLLWFYLLRHSSASQASAWHFLNPLFALVLGALLLGELPHWPSWIGLLPIVLAIRLLHKG